MTKYYKVIMADSRFADEYKIADVNAIPAGTHFRATVPYNSELAINADFPVIHFSNTALDTMLWYEILSKPVGKSKNNMLWYEHLTQSSDDSAIYEVIPLGPVIKQECTEIYTLNQCGSNEIEIGSRISKIDLLRHIQEEFINNIHPKKNAHPQSPTACIIYQWMRDSNVL